MHMKQRIVEVEKLYSCSRLFWFKSALMFLIF